MLERVRMTCFMTANTHPDYSDGWILNELYDQELTLFGRNIVNARSGYWLSVDDRVATAAQSFLTRIPSRAYAGGLESVSVSYQPLATANWIRMTELSENEVPALDLDAGSTGEPYNYVIRGDRFIPVPAANSAVQAYRVKWYRRPSMLVLPQDGRNVLTNNATVTSTPRGLISSYSQLTSTTWAVTCNVFPWDMTPAVPVVPVNGTYLVDIVRNDFSSGFSEVIVANAVASWAGTFPVTLTVSSATGDMNNVLTSVFGASSTIDYLRFVDQCEYPQLPREFHRSLCDATSIKILSELGLDKKAAQLASQLSADLGRFQDVITPRVKSEAKDINMPNLYRGTGRSWQVKFP